MYRERPDQSRTTDEESSELTCVFGLGNLVRSDNRDRSSPVGVLKKVVTIMGPRKVIAVLSYRKRFLLVLGKRLERNIKIINTCQNEL